MKIKSITLEARGILISELDKNGISYTMQELEDSSFPSLNQQNHQSIFIIHEALSNSLIKILERIPDLVIERQEITQKSARKRIYSNLIWVYAVAVTFLLVKYWHINRLNSEQKNFNSSWNWNNTAQTLTDKNTGERVYTYYDKNFDFNYERTIEYLNPKGSNSAYFDKNEDGYYEIIDHYSAKGEYIGTVRDYDFDKIYDEFEIILEDGDTIRLFDQNKNGIYDKLEQTNTKR